jgi:predicted transposase YbfD/YdcC
LPSAVLAGLVIALAQVPDPRQRRGIRHSMLSVLTIAVLAVLAGAARFREIGDFAADLSQESLRRVRARWCPVRGRWLAPSEPTLRRAVQAVDADLLDAVVSQVLTTAAGQRRDLTGLAIDGKTMRGGWVDDQQVRLFAALRHDGAVLAQVRVPNDTTEVTQLDPLLAQLELTGLVVTADAAHANPGFAAYLTGRGADYVVTVKTNRPRLIEAILADLALHRAGWHRHTEHTRGHTVRRSIRLAPAVTVARAGAAQVFQLLRETFDVFGQRISKDLTHGITSLHPDRAGPATITGLVRGHWHIENKLHWVRDVTFGEDHHQTYRGNGPQVLATLRNIAITAVTLTNNRGIKRTLQHFSRDQARTLAILGL